MTFTRESESANMLLRLPVVFLLHLALTCAGLHAAPVPKMKPTLAISLEFDKKKDGICIIHVENQSRESISLKWTIDPVQLASVNIFDENGIQVKTVSPVSRRSPLDPQASYATIFEPGKIVDIPFVINDCLPSKSERGKYKMSVQMKLADKIYDSNILEFNK